MSPPSACTLAELAQRTGAALEGDGSGFDIQNNRIGTQANGTAALGDGSVSVTRVGTLERAGPGDIAFLANPRYRAQLAGTRASAVIVAPADAPHTPLPKLVSSNPYATFAAVAQILMPAAPVVPGIHASAQVAR